MGCLGQQKVSCLLRCPDLGQSNVPHLWRCPNLGHPNVSWVPSFHGFECVQVVNKTTITILTSENSMTE